MKSLFPSNLRARLLLLVVFAMLPSLGLMVWTALEQRRQEIAEAEEHTLRLARLVAANQKQLIEGARHLLVTLAQLPEVRRLDARGCNRLFSNLIKEYPLYANFGAIRPDGDLFCSALPFSGPVQAGDRLYFRAAIRTNGFAVGEYQIGRVTKKPTINFGYPVVNERGEAAAVVFAAMDLKWFQAVVQEMRLPPGATVSLIDHKGTILARIPDYERVAGSSSAETAVGRAVLSNGEGIVDDIGFDGNERLYGFAGVGGGPNGEKVFVWVSMLKEEVFAGVHRSIGRNFVFLVLVTLAVALLAWIGSDVFVLRGIKALVQATRRLAVGEYGARADLSSQTGELGQLGRSFDQMAQALERRYSELQALRDIDQSILSTLELPKVLDVLLEKIDIHLPYAAATVRLFDAGSGELKPVARRNITVFNGESNGGKRVRTLPHLAAEHRAPLAIDNIALHSPTDDRELLLKQGFTSYLGVPLGSKARMLGVISFYTKEEHRFGPEEISYLTTLAGQAGIAIENSLLYEQTRKQAAELEKANSVKSEFLSVMSHELRTPLNVIMGYTGMVQEGIFGPVAPEQKKVLDRVSAQSNDLLRMVTGILLATQLEADEARASFQGTDLNALLEEIRAAYEMPQTRNFRIHWDHPPDLPVIRTDGDKLKHILQNLINNAIKFTIEGEITISVRAPARAGRVEFGVADTGAGIAPDKIPIVFRMFQQGDGSETRRHGGVGLGLYIVRKYTEMLGGTIAVESAVGKGTRFTVALPREQAGAWLQAAGD